MMEHFGIESGYSTEYFRTTLSLDLCGGAPGILTHKPLEFGERLTAGEMSRLLNTLSLNCSHKISLRWAFLREQHFYTVMGDCLAGLECPQHIISDVRRDWFGFLDFDMLHYAAEGLQSVENIIWVNDCIVAFQHVVLERFVSHPLVVQHALIYDEDYRHWYFRGVRHDRDKLGEAYQFFLDGWITVCDTGGISHNRLESMLGCHFLDDPELYYELLNFSILKGEVRGRVAT